MRDKAIRKFEKRMDQELEKQCVLICSAVAIAMHENWGWRKTRITDLISKAAETWHECAETNEKSMIQMLEEETGIEIQNGSGKSWREYAFMNAKMPVRPMNAEQWMYMRQRQMKWIAPQFTACILLALYRKAGFGAERCARAADLIRQIQEEYGFRAEAVKKACEEITGISAADLMDRKLVEMYGKTGS